ncbi:Ribonucleotide-diphosphate reductase (RNR), small subunit [Rhizina undulata]
MRCIWNMYKKAEASFWIAEEIDLFKDLKDWNNQLTNEERHFVSHVLAFFAALDRTVNENHVQKFSNERHYLYDAIDTIPCIRKKAHWTIRCIKDKDSSFAQRLVALAAVEGIFFSGSFASIFWSPNRLRLTPLFSPQQTSQPPSNHRYYKEAVEIEQVFLIDALPCSLLGMNSTLMKQYIQFVADRLLVALGNPKFYNSTNSFDFMDSISLSGKTNFFDKRVSDYQKAEIMASTSFNDVISFNQDF